jgi:(p)ppGpp synthase/HD superfamily hydrolase
VLAHLLGVCALVQHHGGSEDEAIAALLHDALEDKPDLMSPEDIRARFGEVVLQLVLVATDTPPGYAGGAKSSWSDRKEAYLRDVRKKDPSLLRVTVADKVDNLRALLADYVRIGEPFWDRFNAPRDAQLWYYRAAAEAYRTAGFSGPLLAEMERLVGALEAEAARRA